VVLLAEDDAESRALLAAVLEMHGIRVIQAADGQEAVLLAFDHRPDAVVVDVVMPVMDGLAVARAIASDRVTSGTPVLAMSGLLSGDNQRRALDAGCVAYLRKPFPPPVLVEAVRHWIAEGRRRRSS
jgi:CheY-like chemotaxis protein